MDTEVDHQYFTYEGRLASFKPTKKRGSTANGRGTKGLNWPHKSIAAVDLAKAGFFFCPTPENPDNVMCFLCQKGLDGWEAGDDPLHEHLMHAGHCGWAIVAAIESELDNYVKEDPNLPSMIEARKATFAGRWPHEGKRGWKCKTKQLVDAGWKYTPSLESDDMATCVYCQLALDGWEQNDKPLDEHYNRAPGCAFFKLVNQSQGTKKTARGKTASASKASRLSVQSAATFASDATSLADLTAAPEDSVLTTASTMTQGGKKSKAKKGTGKGRKIKAKKEEPVQPSEEPVVEPIEAPEEPIEEPAELPMQVEPVVSQEEPTIASPPPPPAKATRGKKRGSEAVEESTVTMTQAPAPKKRATKGRGSVAVNSSVLTVDTDMTDVPALKTIAAKKGRASKAQATRKVSARSNASTASVMSLGAEPGEFPDDDEIERQLQAELEWDHSEDEIALDSESERKKSQAKVKAKPSRGQMKKSADDSFEFAMFDPSPIVPDEAAVEDELAALEAEMQVDEPQLQVPKKGRKPGVRKASKQTKATKAKATPAVVEEEPEYVAAVEEQTGDKLLQEEEDASIGSTGTVVKASEPAKRRRGRPSKASLASQDADEVVEIVEQVEPVQPPVKRGRGRPSKASLASQDFSEIIEFVKPAEPAAKRGRGRPSKASLLSQSSDRAEEPSAIDATSKRGRGRPPKTSGGAKASTGPRELESPAAPQVEAEAEPTEAEDTEEAVARQLEAESSPFKEPETSPAPPSQSRLLQPPSTPGKVISPAPSAMQPALSPSQSPQSSDAENQPPSSKPAASTTTKRTVLAPLAATPMHGSPSKRNVLAGLRSTTPWTAVDLDAVFGTPRVPADKENAAGRIFKQGRELTSPEKRMTVEEWIYHNAGEAEKKLKHECETMVSRFESEGTKAMNVLEGLATNE